MTAAGPVDAAADLDELARFREEWKREVEDRRNLQSAQPSASPSVSKRRIWLPTSSESDPSNSTVSGPPTAFAPTSSEFGLSSDTVSGSPIAFAPTSAFFNTSAIPSSVRHALAVYRRAVQHEQSGKLDEALALYRQAFRMEPNVDRVYQTTELLESISAAQTQSESGAKAEEQLEMTLQTAAVAANSGGERGGAITGTLADLINNFHCPNLKFEPEDERKRVHLNALPEELLVAIMRKLDHTSIERFGVVSRKARVLTLDSGIWRELVVLSYRPPQVPSFESMVPVVAQYHSDFRRLYIEHPRLRLDGVYIAVCHYVRPGLSENHWVNITHLITYHRYLRFFPDGKVLSLLANEETPPAQVIPTLKLSLRKKGLFIGTWKLSGSVVTITNLLDASGRFPIPPTSPAGDEPFARYAFSMVLSLRSRPVGRWNKLELTAYNSVDLESGDSTPFPLRHERPFWFSKVKSFPPF